MEFDFSKLLGRIVEKYGTRSAFAEVWGVNDSYLSNRLNNKVNFDSKDIHKCCLLLDIQPIEIPVYFFTLKVR